MDIKSLFSQQFLVGWLLILSGLVFLPGATLFAGRVMWKWPAGKSQAYLYWERGLVIAAVVVAFLGWMLLEKLLETAKDVIFAPLALALFIAATGLVLFEETYELSKDEFLYPPIVAHVVLAFLAQALFGLSILQTGLLPGWVGWATILWSVVLLIVLPIRNPKEIYYPYLHYVIPILIGIMLLSKGGG